MTLRDVARRAGVSAAAVSLTFNGRPGVSPATRRRIETAAAALNWQPGSAARTAAARATAHGDTVALALATGPAPAQSPQLAEFLAGALGELGRVGRQALLTRPHSGPAHDDLLALRQWWQAGRICGAVLFGAQPHATPAEGPASPGLPAVSVAPPGRRSGGVPTLWWDDRATADAAVTYLAALGHRRIAYVCDGSAPERLAVFRGSAATRGLTATGTAAADPAAVARTTRHVLSHGHAPTAVIYDTGLMAAVGLSVAGEMALDVPRSLSILAWQDSPLCALTRPQITAMTNGTDILGSHAVRSLLALLTHQAVAPLPDAIGQPAHRHSVAAVHGPPTA